MIHDDDYRLKAAAHDDDFRHTILNTKMNATRFVRLVAIVTVMESSGYDNYHPHDLRFVRRHYTNHLESEWYKPRVRKNVANHV